MEEVSVWWLFGRFRPLDLPDARRWWIQQLLPHSGVNEEDNASTEVSMAPSAGFTFPPKHGSREPSEPKMVSVLWGGFLMESEESCTRTTSAKEPRPGLDTGPPT